jgi:hypothetical protein
MGLREELGGKLETALNKLVDEKLQGVSTESLKAEAHKLIDGLIDKHIGGLLTGLADKLKKDVIDLIDGEDDIK